MKLLTPDGKEIQLTTGGSPDTEPMVPSPLLIEQARAFRLEGAVLWEEKLRLVVNPPPRWLPGFIYRAAVRLVVKQEESRKVFHENWTRRRRWSLFRPAKV